MSAHRFDIGGLRPLHRTPEGYLICDAIVSRVGVFEYRNADGSVRHEARFREDVVELDSLSTIAGRPIVLGHPRDDNGEPIWLNPDNVQSFQVGTVGTELHELASGHIKAQLIVTRRDAIDAIEKRHVRGVSPGYRVREDRTPGKLDGQHYDLRQRTIRYNHVAIVPVGRQGIELRADEACAIRLDSDEIEEFPAAFRLDAAPPTEPERVSMAKIKIDGVEYEVADGAAAAVASVQHRNDALTTAVEGHTKRADEAERAMSMTGPVEQIPMDGDDLLRNAMRCRMMLDAGWPVPARFIAALFDVSSSTARRRMKPYGPVRARPEMVWASDDVLHEFCGGARVR